MRLLLALGALGVAQAALPAGEYMVPMTDGVKLHTKVFLPAELPLRPTPAVYVRSPYGEHRTELVAALFVPFGFVAVMQDMRGTHQSEGNFTVRRRRRRAGAGAALTAAHAGLARRPGCSGHHAVDFVPGVVQRPRLHGGRERRRVRRLHSVSARPWPPPSRRAARPGPELRSFPRPCARRFSCRASS